MAKAAAKLMLSFSLSAGLAVAWAPVAFAAAPPAHSNAGGSAGGPADGAGGAAKGEPDEKKAGPDEANGEPREQNAQADHAKGEPGDAKGRPDHAKGEPGDAKGRPDHAKGEPSEAKGQREAQGNGAEAGSRPRGGNPGGDGGRGTGNAGNAGRSGGRPAPAGKGQGDAPAARTAPAGNNGTIKVDMDGAGLDRRNNEPKGGCDGVVVKFFNFDPAERISVAFRGQSPTPFGQTATSAVTADAGGHATARFSFAQIVAAGAAPAPNGGWHVRVEANGLNHPAGVKTKVFWLRCATAAGATTATAPTAAGPAVEPGAAPKAESKVEGAATPAQAPQQVQGEPPAAATASRAAVLGEVMGRGRGATVAGTRLERLTESPAAAGVNEAAKARVLGVTVERGALARTGLDALQLATIGALLVLGGCTAVRASRRHRTTNGA